jgi:hypothetical protein
MRGLLVVGLVTTTSVGCAGGGEELPDAKRYLDAPVDIILNDTPPTQTLSQTTSSTIEAAVGAACNASGSGTAANNYYRVFDLATFGITTDFHVYNVSFQVEHCHEFAASAGKDVTVRVGTYSEAPGEMLAFASMTILRSASAHVPEVISTITPPFTPGGTVTAPFDVVIPAGSKLLVEVDAPDGNGEYAFYMGANTQGESAHGYVLAPTCGIPVPTNLNTLKGSAAHMLLTVSGAY